MAWDLSSYFPSFNGPEMLRFKEELRAEISSLRDRSAALAPLDASTLDNWAEVLQCNEDLVRRMSHLGSYIGCLAAADARNEAYLKEEAALAQLRAELAKVRIELLRAIKNVTDEIFSSLIASPSLAGAGNYLNRLREEARRALTFGLFSRPRTEDSGNEGRPPGATGGCLSPRAD